MQFVWRVRPGASTIGVGMHFQFGLNGQNPESFDEGHIHVYVQRH